MQPTLLVLAAGIGSRYGGLKQIDPVGPNGETIIDYSVYDAMRAGFGKLVFVIRRDIENLFRESIEGRFAKRLPVECVFQELDELPSGFIAPQARTKPWGTGHAILAADSAVHEPFAAINADDFYGRSSFHVLADYLMGRPLDYAMVGFKLANTLSEHGAVSRGVCECEADGALREVNELTKIARTDGGIQSAERELSGEEIVSMNFWGFTPAIFSQLRERFAAFLRQQGDDPKAEFFIPSVLNELIASGQARVRVLSTSDVWFGVTYQKDKARVAEGIRQMIARGIYPERLWDRAV